MTSQLGRWVTNLAIGIGLAAAASAYADSSGATAARKWRQANERAILDQYVEFLRIPNWARDLSSIRANAAHLVGMMERRGLKPRLLEVEGAPPLVYGEWLVPGATSTYVFYSHYDGQPVEASEWLTPPFEPTLRDGRHDLGGTPVSPASSGPLNPDWRLYARSAADAKAPIMALLAGVDALRSAGISPKANLKFVFDGEEEIGSPHLGEFLRVHGALLSGDLWLLCDGPMHASGAPTVVFGARGGQGLEITVFGASRELHSGHYGNWAPNPAMLLAQLLASMKDENGRVRVKGFYDGIAPLSKLERQAIKELPDTDADQRKALGLARTEGGSKRLDQLVTLPSLTIRGLSSGFTGTQAANAIPATATANIEMRLVKGITRQQAASRIIEHVRQQRYHVVTADPDQALRLQHPKIAKILVDPAGFDPIRTPMDLPRAAAVVAAVRGKAASVLRIPMMGGSLPLAPVEASGTPLIIVPIVNHDNSQHARNENLRLGNLWSGIETMTALLMLE